MEFNGTFLATIITFIVFVFLMNKILYAPVLSVMEERRRVIDGNYQSASNNDTKTEELTNQKEEKLEEAKSDARSKYVDTLDDFKSKKTDLVSDAQKVAQEELETSRANLENLSNETKQGLKNKMTDLANDITEKILGYRSEVKGFDNDVVDRVLWKE